MRIGRTIPPAASPIYLRDIVNGIRGLVHGQREIERFSAELRKYFGAKHCFLVSSGKAALTLILLGLRNMHPGRDEVLIPAFTCYSVPSAIVRARSRVRLCDICPSSFDYDFEKLRNILSESCLRVPADGMTQAKPGNGAKSQLLAILSVHLFGLPADVEKIRSLCRDRQVTIIEDAAQCLGGTFAGRKLGTLGDVSFFSLGRGKSLSTSEGGVILTNCDPIAERLEELVGRRPGYGPFGVIKLAASALFLSIFSRSFLFWVPKAIPFLKLGQTLFDPGFEIRRMSGFQAGIARGWENKLRGFKKKRLSHSKNWVDLMGGERKSRLVEIPFQVNGSSSIGSLIRFPLMINQESCRGAILRASEKAGLGIMAAYPDSIDGINELEGQFAEQSFPGAKEAAQKMITLPVHPLLTHEDTERISKLFKDVDPSCSSAVGEENPGISSSGSGRKGSLRYLKSRASMLYIICICLVLSFSVAVWGNGAGKSLIEGVGGLIERNLVSENTVPPSTSLDAAYILGGPPKSLEFKFRMAGSLYKKGIIKTIIIQSQPGITEYSPSLNRNLTKDEWALKRLEGFGINPNDVEIVSLDAGFFGTLSEARGISHLIGSRGLKNIGLISGSYHTKRVRISFEKLLNDRKEREVALYVLGSSERVGLAQLLIELIKLKAYELVIL